VLLNLFTLTCIYSTISHSCVSPYHIPTLPSNGSFYQSYEQSLGSLVTYVGMWVCPSYAPLALCVCACAMGLCPLTLGNLVYACTLHLCLYHGGFHFCSCHKPLVLMLGTLVHVAPSTFVPSLGTLVRVCATRPYHTQPLDLIPLVREIDTFESLSMRS
jgi:hypothetical protein